MNESVKKVLKDKYLYDLRRLNEAKEMLILDERRVKESKEMINLLEKSLKEFEQDLPELREVKA